MPALRLAPLALLLKVLAMALPHAHAAIATGSVGIPFEFAGRGTAAAVQALVGVPAHTRRPRLPLRRGQRRRPCHRAP